LGITIGIFTIISVFTVLDWMEKSIRNSVAQLGNDIIYVQKYPMVGGPNTAWWDIMRRPAVTIDDYRALTSNMTKASAICYSVSQRRQIKYKNNSANVEIWSVTHEFEDIRSFEIEKGRYFSPEESAAGRNVVIVGAVIAEQLFEKANPVGKEITIGGYRATVIGVFKKEGKGTFINIIDMDEMTLLPINYARNFVNLRNRNIPGFMMVKAKEKVSMQELNDEIVMTLRASRRLKPDQPSNFSADEISVVNKMFDPVFAGIKIGGWIIGGFSILVGGFGIANIMFVSVRERTNQIGIQKALGAKKSFILQQFLVESLMLSIIGGFLGILLIFIATVGINYVFELNIHLTLSNIILALTISGTIGIVAGYSPANTAAKMNPVEAIGYSFG
jgi:putative ABC transport system permease protein